MYLNCKKEKKFYYDSFLNLQTVNNLDIPLHLHINWIINLMFFSSFERPLLRAKGKYTPTIHQPLGRTYSLEKSMAKPDLVM